MAEAGGAVSAPQTLALLPWGDVIEDFLDGIGVSLETFATEMTGGWLFGYVEALRRVGVRTVIVCVSKQVCEPTCFTHGPTDATVWALPAPRSYLRLRRLMRDPYGWTVEDMFGPASGPRRAVQRLIRDVAPYLAMPPRSLARVLRDEGCDAVLCQEYEYPRFDVAVRVGRRLGLPVFATFQGGDWQTSRIERWLRPRSLRAAAGLIIPTSTEAARVQARYGVPDAQIARIFNPLDVESWTRADRYDARRDLGFANTAAVVVWHGRVDLHRKGLDVLLDAWTEVVRVRPKRDLRLLLIGTGPSADELRVRVEADEHIHWIDEYVLDRDRLRRLLATADVYAFPSRHEGFPVALVEALASGLPVVAADAPGVPDILCPDPACGSMVPRGEVATFARALGDLLDDPHQATMGRAARQRAETAFSLDAVGAQLKAFLFSDR